MQGVIDFQMRQLLTAVGGYDRCVTEFVRVTDHRVPEKVFRRYCPEIETGGHTDSGVPVFVQLLGGDPKNMARSAHCAASLGAAGIDLNFGCPAKIVNRNDGGSVLLKRPRRVFDIISAVRESVPNTIAVTAKVRLGFEDDSLFSEIVVAAAAAGATELCIHARTKVQGYRAPAYWSTVGGRRATTEIPVIINGEIWTPLDANNATQQSASRSVMLGRGALSCPDLALQIKASNQSIRYEPMTWASVLKLVQHLFDNSSHIKPKYVGNRTKQWLSYLMRQYPQANPLFHRIKRSIDSKEIGDHLTNGQMGKVE